jgi:uncharacterized protein
MVSSRMPAEGGRLSWLITGASVGVLAAVLLAPHLGTVARAADSTNPEHTISVSGTGRILVKPDIADVSIGVSVSRSKARQSEQDAAALMADVIAALKAAGVKDADIQTANLSLSPEYDWSSNTQRLTGYRTDNIVSVTIRDLEKVGETIDAAVDAGATAVNGISFRVSDETKVQEQARAAAMADAKSKGDALAKAAGVSISGVQSISEISSPMPTPIMYANAGVAARDATTPIQPGQVSLEVTVTVVYLIG